MIWYVMFLVFWAGGCVGYLLCLLVWRSSLRRGR